MDYAQICELMHLRHELRRFSSEDGRDPREASSMLSRMSALAARDPAEQAVVEPELERWRFRLGLSIG